MIFFILLILNSAVLIYDFHILIISVQEYDVGGKLNNMNAARYCSLLLAFLFRIRCANFTVNVNKMTLLYSAGILFLQK